MSGAAVLSRWPALDVLDHDFTPGQGALVNRHGPQFFHSAATHWLPFTAESS
jgi:hypothetical protein